jgi:DNA-binding NarL/FixJ family response regulator
MKVLLVDDHQILRDGIRRGLEGAGVDVVGEASNGEEAVALANETTPDIVLMDLSMPVLDGVQATQRIRDAQPDTPSWSSPCTTTRTGHVPHCRPVRPRT